ncbi:TMV resistance protein N-like [Quercus robur]|uniref:TMV resistance protein N-like n=1 Tax=Quercus robur TaxID=38942 RepID=UPI002163260B|nr:TMV resistance protein N-like [Quercus robur]
MKSNTSNASYAFVLGSCFESETQFIKRIIENISSSISNRTELFVAKYPVGIDSRVKEIELLLDTNSNGVHMLGIHGLGGVGKTTIAKAIYNRIFYQFDKRCFLENVRERSWTTNGIIQLQETLLSKILQDTYLKVDNISQGIELIMGRLCHTRLLLILDDVDESNQIENLLGRCDWFSSGSRIIITTRDKQVLTTLGKDHLVYGVKELNQCEAYKLFSLHAFQMNKPREDYLEVAKQTIHYANGLPLALTIIGSYLCGKSIDKWENALEKYKNIPHKKIQEKLKISYDGLEKTEKDIFLYVACFFKGFGKDYVIDILETCNLYPRDGICQLIDKCLITVDRCGILSMHDLLQQMGKEIVQQESENPENRSRIWCYEDAYEVLTGNTGTDKIQAMILRSPKPVTMKLQGEPFERMKNLKFLFVENVHICGEFQYLPHGLRLFEWHEFPFSSWPSKYCPQKLVALNMSWSIHIRMETIFEQSGIREVPSSIGYLTQLTGLWLYGNHNLRDLPDSIYKLQMLEHFSFGSAKLRPPCNSFDGLSEYGFQRLRELRFGRCGNKLEFLMKPNYFPVLSLLDLSGSDIVSIPESLNRFTTLKNLNIRNCQQLRQILGLPQFIRKLDASHCRSLDAQSSSRLLNQIGEIVCEGEKSDIYVYPRWLNPELQSRDLFRRDINDYRMYMLPYTEIPRWLNSKHQSVGNSKVVEFRVGREFPNVFAVYFAFGLGPQLSSYHVYLNVYLSINGYEKVEITRFILNRDSEDTLGISSRSHLKLQKLLDESNPSDDNHVKATYEWAEETDRNNPPCEIRWGVKVECICCPQISSISTSMALTLVYNDSHSDLNLPLKKRRKY